MKETKKILRKIIKDSQKDQDCNDNFYSSLYISKERTMYSMSSRRKKELKKK